MTHPCNWIINPRFWQNKTLTVHKPTLPNQRIQNQRIQQWLLGYLIRHRIKGRSNLPSKWLSTVLYTDNKNEHFMCFSLFFFSFLCDWDHLCVKSFLKSHCFSSPILLRWEGESKSSVKVNKSLHLVCIMYAVVQGQQQGRWVNGMGWRSPQEWWGAVGAWLKSASTQLGLQYRERHT